MPRSTPQGAWRALESGNERFVTGVPLHPNQGVDGIDQLVGGQSPSVVLFGCADSRVAAEIIFDQGLGDMFVVRTAGHTLDGAVLGSIEYAVEVLDVPLIAILGHDSCGAVRATMDTLDNGAVPPGFIREVVEKVSPSVLAARREGVSGADDLMAWHVAETGRLLLQRSRIIADRVGDGRAAIVGLTYQLAKGKVHLREAIGDIGADIGEGSPTRRTWSTT